MGFSFFVVVGVVGLISSAVVGVEIVACAGVFNGNGASLVIEDCEGGLHIGYKPQVEDTQSENANEYPA